MRFGMGVVCVYLLCDLWPLVQVKPLLQVTRQDEEVQAREAQLQKAKDNMSKLEQDFSELDRKNQQVTLFPCFAHFCWAS